MSVYFLYGPPGTGKTTLGKALARRLQVPFLDLDADMERAAGLTVAELFQREGEASFRVREKAALVRAAARTNSGALDLAPRRSRASGWWRSGAGRCWTTRTADSRKPPDPCCSWRPRKR